MCASALKKLTAN